MRNQVEKIFQHTPIMVNDCLHLLQPEREGIYVDCTLGGGGHSEAILQCISSTSRLIGIDRDEDALGASDKRLKQYKNFSMIHGNFFDIKQLLQNNNIGKVDGILADLGVSSYQLDEPSRGFSYQWDAPLDMRMDQNADFSAFTVVNQYSQEQLTAVIRNYGEEKWASRIAKFIVEARPIATTYELVDVIKRAIPSSARRDGPHPAKRTFQAIRIEVNGELDALSKAIEDMIDCLQPAGRLAIITFHSLEDRIVKQTFAYQAVSCVCPPKAPICTCEKQATVRVLTRKPIIANENEIAENPRARSAKLRGIERI